MDKLCIQKVILHNLLVNLRAGNNESESLVSPEQPTAQDFANSDVVHVEGGLLRKD